MILLDTHIVAWLALEPDQLSKRARERIAAERLTSGGLAISDVTLWELASMSRKSHALKGHSVVGLLSEVERTFTILPVTASIAKRAIDFSERYPRDPMDRIIGATALNHRLDLLTRDVQITASGEVPCLW